MTPGKCVLLVVDNNLTHDARVRREADTLAGNGYKVRVVARTFRDKRVSRLGNLLVIGGVAPSPYSRFFTVRVILALWRKFKLQLSAIRLARRLKPDVVQAHDIDVLPGAWLAARLLGCPIIYDIHELHPAREEFGWLQRPLAWIERYLVHRVDAAMAPTDMRSDWLRDFYGIQRPVVIPNRPPYVKIQRGKRLRDELSIPDGNTIFLYQGVVNEGRGLHNAVRAINAVDNSTLVILGSGRLVDSLTRLADEIDVRSKVRFHPAVPLEELPEFTASADIGLQLLRNTSINHYTTDSNKLYEYIMAGLPVIASDFPEIRKIVESCDVGKLVDPEDVGAISSAMNAMSSDKSFLEKMRANAMKSGEAISWEKVEHRLLDLYKSVLK